MWLDDEKIEYPRKSEIRNKVYWFERSLGFIIFLFILMKIENIK